MYRSLLVPLDGSLAAEHALPWALSIAQQDGVALHLVRVHVPPAPLMIGSELAADVVFDRTILQIETDYVEGMAKRLSTLSTVPIHHALLERAVPDAINDYAAKIGADLIVMTSHGRGAFARFWLGSVADRVIRHCHTPVLLVRANDDQSADLTTRPFIHRIVVPLDGSELAELIIEPAVKLGKATGAGYALLMALEPRDNNRPDGGFPEAVQTKAEAYLGRFARRLQADSLLAKTNVIHAASAAAAILDFVGNTAIRSSPWQLTANPA